MSVIVWILLGLVSGYIANRIAGHAGSGLLADTVFGVLGALVGGAAFHLIGGTGITGFNIWSVFVSVIGAFLLLGAYRLLAGRPARA